MGTRFVMIEERFLDYHSYDTVYEINLKEFGFPGDTEIIKCFRDVERNRCFKVLLSSGEWRGCDFQPVEFPPDERDVERWLRPVEFDSETLHYRKWKPIFVEVGQ